MAEPVVTTQTNTDAGNANADVKPSETLLSAASDTTAPAATTEPTATTQADPKDSTTAKDGAPAKEGDKAGEAKAPVGAPEKYEFTAPEGVTLDTELVTELSTVAKELNLPQEQAQKFATMGTKLVEKTLKTIQETQSKSWADARTQWVTDIKNDKEIGGSNFAQSNEMAKRAVRFAGIPELKQVFDAGWGDHPALFKAFVKFGKAIGDDKLIDPDATSAAKSAADVLYPNQGKTA